MSILPLLIITASISSAITAFFVYLFNKRQKDKTPNYTGTPLTIDKAQKASLEALHQAIKKSQDLLSESEVEQIKDIAESKMETRLFESHLEEQFEKQSEEYRKFLEDLKVQAASAQENNQALIIGRINSLFENFEQNLANFLTQTQQQSLSSIDLELKAARAMVDTYRQQQLRLIDENIIAVLERTLSLVLIKKLTLKDQVDLVYESLEKAKTEKFIV